MVQSSSSDTTTHHDRVFMDFSCVYDRDDARTVMIRNRCVVQLLLL